MFILCGLCEGTSITVRGQLEKLSPLVPFLGSIH